MKYLQDNDDFDSRLNELSLYVINENENIPIIVTDKQRNLIQSKNIDSSFQLLRLAEKIRTTIESFKFEEVGYKTISLGISTFEDNDTIESLIKKADIALYQAKNSGRNRYKIYKKEEE